MDFCAECGTRIASGTAMCAVCGTKVAVSRFRGRIPDSFAGVLAYVAVVPAVIFLTRQPYKARRFVRFHALQSIFFAIIVVVVFSAVGFAGAVRSLGPFFFLFLLVLGLGFVILWLVLLLKAAQGEMFKLPVIGDLAEKQASAISGSQVPRDQRRKIVLALPDKMV